MLREQKRPHVNPVIFFLLGSRPGNGQNVNIFPSNVMSRRSQKTTGQEQNGNRMYLWWSLLRTLYLHTSQVRVTVGHSSSFLVVLVLRISSANYFPCVLIRRPILIADTYITIVFLFAERKVSACSYTAAVAENARKATCNSL